MWLDVPIFLFLYPFPLSIRFLTLFWMVKRGRVQVNRSLCVGSSPINQVTALSRTLVVVDRYLSSLSQIRVTVFLCRRFHRAVVASMCELCLYSLSTINHKKNQPRTMSTQVITHGKHSVSACSRYFHVRRYQANRTMGGQSIAMPWPATYSSSSEDSSFASS